MMDWFTTIPGILIICGVLLLIIAIVLFIVGSKKEKKDKKEVVDSNVNTLVNENVTPIPVMEKTVVNDSVNMSNVNIVAEPSVEEVSKGEIPTIDIPVPEVVSSKEESLSSKSVIEPEKSVETVSVYGGNTPVYNFTTENKPVTIYGGNDPLEATQTLPKMGEHHLPYGGSISEIKNNDASVVNIPTEEIPTVDVVTPVINIPSDEDDVPVVEEL